MLKFDIDIEREDVLKIDEIKVVELNISLIDDELTIKYGIIKEFKFTERLWLFEIG